MSNHKPTVKEMFGAAQASRNGGKIITLDNAKGNANPSPSMTPGPRITEDLIYQAFSIIDSHTRYLDNQTIVNNLNMSIQVLSTILTTQHSTEWNINEDRCKELINEYLPLFIRENSEESLKVIDAHVRDYITYSCLIYYAVSHKDPSLMEEYNKKIASAIAEIIKFARGTAPVSSQIPKADPTSN